MLSHLRFHRRGASNPASPTPDQQHHCLSPLSSHGSSTAPDSASSSDALPASSSLSLSAVPPTLPPIARVTSADADLGHACPRDIDVPWPPDVRPQQASRLPHHGESRFMGGVALRHYRRGAAAAQQSGAQPVAPPAGQTRRQHPIPTTEGPPRSHAKHTPSFSTPTELQKSATNTTPAGRMPPGAPSPNQASHPSSTSGAAEPPRGRKGLPFLKNPMSTLLMRRKNNQNTPDLLPLPLPSHGEEPVYDPRIRGTRVHDFSTPRCKQLTSRRGVASARPCSGSGVSADADRPPCSPEDTKHSWAPGHHQLRNLPKASDSAHAPPTGTASQLISLSPHGYSDQANGSSPTHASALADGDPDAPPVPPKDHVGGPSSPSPSSSSASPPAAGAHESPRACTSTRTARSRNISLSDMSGLPKHMKSTSSRFSFDMVGAAKQERILEERHRQRELERQASSLGQRDSRFDDLDEDALDYDAMMDDGGLEESIPGINADFDAGGLEDELDPDNGQEELDPDNDQENFAGFVFQRSNPTSSLASPQGVGIMVTPRDMEGKVIGFAMSKDTPSLATFPLSPQTQTLSLDHTLRGDVSGLGIQAPCVSGSAEQLLQPVKDDLYFDDGLIGVEDEFSQDLAAVFEADTVPFDESIFDNNDTDEFGRPVPGAFAQAQSLRCAANQNRAAKQEDDMASRFSRSPARTPPSEHAPGDGECTDKTLAKCGRGSLVGARGPADVEQDSVAAYQAALAAAAHRAAASGKFQRSSSPPRGDDGESRGHSDDSLSGATEDEGTGNVGPGYVEVDDVDVDVDDDAIIAEANASALANDLDGWYGQEFGFYSASTVQHHGPHGSSPSKSPGYEYANGGFFGPKGMGGLDRSASDRMVSREPNLTPITERSEYSNRNSVMSPGFPLLSSPTPLVQSPGLAQLAMMADRGDEQMTLSALLRLRSKAWGGSQASLASSKEGSPRSERGDTASFPWGSNSASAVLGPSSHGRKGSVFSAVSRDSEAASTSASPTLTMACPAFSSPCPVVPMPAEQPEFLIDPQALSCGCLACPEEQDMAVVSWRRSARGHHRHKSSADSVSYLKEEESGETRWVMERRRTAESGQVEILEREVVEGGRI